MVSSLNRQVEDILRRAKTVAVVGISNNPDRASYGVAKYLQRFYEVIAINPNLSDWEGQKCYPSLLKVPVSTKIDIVDIFRASEKVFPIVDDAIEHAAIDLIWMQEGVVHQASAQRAEAAGIAVVMDACLAVIHSQTR